MTARKPSGKGGVGSARAAISAAVNSATTQEAIQELIAEVFSAEASADAVCPACGEEMRVRVKDAKRIVDSLTALIEQAEGRTEQRAPEATTIVIERPGL